MSAEESVGVVRRFIDAWNHGQLDAVDELFALSQQPQTDEHSETLAHLKQRMRVYLTAFPDLKLGVEQLLAHENEVVVRWTLRGTHTGLLMGQPAALVVSEPLRDQDSVLRMPVTVYPTGRVVVFQGVSSFRIEDGKITWYWMLLDALSLLRQLGVMPVVQPEER